MQGGFIIATLGGGPWPPLGPLGPLGPYGVDSGVDSEATWAPWAPWDPWDQGPGPRTLGTRAQGPGPMVFSFRHAPGESPRDLFTKNRTEHYTLRVSILESNTIDIAF